MPELRGTPRKLRHFLPFLGWFSSILRVFFVFFVGLPGCGRVKQGWYVIFHFPCFCSVWGGGGGDSTKNVIVTPLLCARNASKNKDSKAVSPNASSQSTGKMTNRPHFARIHWVFRDQEAAMQFAMPDSQVELISSFERLIMEAIKSGQINMFKLNLWLPPWDPHLGPQNTIYARASPLGGRSPDKGPTWVPKEPFRTKNTTALNSVVFCYCRSFFFNYFCVAICCFIPL